jgi:hypothetical protein
VVPNEPMVAADAAATGPGGGVVADVEPNTKAGATTAGAAVVNVGVGAALEGAPN